MGFWTPLGQAQARYPKDYRAQRPRVPVAGGEYPEQWSATLPIPANTTVNILEMNLDQDRDYVMVWSEEQNGGFGCRITVDERVPRASKTLSFDVGSGGGNQAKIRGAVSITARGGPGPCTLALWVYSGEVLDRAPISHLGIGIADDGGGNPGAWTGLGAAQNWPPKDRNNLELGGSNNFNWRLLDEAGNVVTTRNGRQLDQLYHPPRAQLQVQNPGGPNINIIGTWRRTF